MGDAPGRVTWEVRLRKGNGRDSLGCTGTEAENLTLRLISSPSASSCCFLLDRLPAGDLPLDGALLTGERERDEGERVDAGDTTCFSSCLALMRSS